MKKGMMWFNNDSKSKSMAIAIDEAIDFYFRKHNIKPTTCYVHPSAIDDTNLISEALILNIEIIPSKYILKNNLWIGVEEHIMKILIKCISCNKILKVTQYALDYAQMDCPFCGYSNELSDHRLLWWEEGKEDCPKPDYPNITTSGD